MVCLREQEGFNRTNEQLRAMVNLLLEKSHTQGVTGTWLVQLLGYSAIRGKKNPKLKSQGELPAQQCPTPSHPAACCTTCAPHTLFASLAVF